MKNNFIVSETKDMIPAVCNVRDWRYCMLHRYSQGQEEDGQIEQDTL